MRDDEKAFYRAKNGEEVYYQALDPRRFRRVPLFERVVEIRALRKIAREADGEWVLFDCGDQEDLADRIRNCLKSGPYRTRFEYRRAGDVILLRWRAEGE